MRCDEFETVLQQLADDRRSAHDESALRQHAQSCSACRELENGFRLLAQAFAVSRVPEPSIELANRIVEAAQPTSPVRPWWRHHVPWLAAAAAVLLALGWWLLPSQTNVNRRRLANPDHPPVITHPSPAEELLFPELAAANAEETRDGAVLAQAVEPFSEIFRAVGRSFTSPVRPIAAATSEALGNLLNDLPETDLSAMPGVREMMPSPMKKDMPEMRPSS
jgi:hypothetical protein